MAPDVSFLLSSNRTRVFSIVLWIDTAFGRAREWTIGPVSGDTHTGIERVYFAILHFFNLLIFALLIAVLCACAGAVFGSHPVLFPVLFPVGLTGFDTLCGRFYSFFVAGSDTREVIHCQEY